MFKRHVFFPCLLLLLLCATRDAGAQWIRQAVPIGTQGPQSGIAMFDSSRGVSVGRVNLSAGNISGVLVKTSAGNTAWTPVDSIKFSPVLRRDGVGTFWSSATALPGGTAFICGDPVNEFNSVYKTTDFGANWFRVIVGMPFGLANVRTLYDISFIDDMHGMVVGQAGAAYYTSNGGADWITVATGTTNNLTAVHSGGGDWFLCGANRTILKYTPGAPNATAVFGVPPGPASAQIEGVWFISPLTGFFGIGNLVVKTTDGGGSFSSITTPPLGSAVNTVRFFDAMNGWASGVYNAFYNTTNGGASWTTYFGQPAGPAGAATRICFTDPSVGYASGPSNSAPAWILRWTPTASPDISTTTTLADFGAFGCGTFADVVITINNTGGGDLTIAANGITLPPGFTLVAPDIPPFTIPGGGSQTITVRWTPPAGQADSIAPGTTLAIASNDAAHTPWLVTLRGRHDHSAMVVNSALAITPACLGSTTTGDLDYTTTGNTNPTFVAFEFVSGDNEFTVASPATGSVVSGPGVIQVVFQPTTRGLRRGVYRVLSGNPACPDTQTVVIAGLGVEARAQVITSPVVFGHTCPLRPVDREFLVINTGDETEFVDALTFVSGAAVFSVITPLPSAALAVGDTLHIQVLMSPGAADLGLLSAQFVLSIRTDPHGCTADIPVRFEGESIRPDVEVVPNPVDFGSLVVGTNSSKIVTVTNKGTAPVRISTIKLAGGHPSVTKSGDPPMPRTLAPGESFTFTITFAPIKPETLTVDVQVGYSDPCTDAVTVPILGEAGAAPRIVAPSALDLGIEQCAVPVQKTFPIRNTGDGPLQITVMKTVGAQAGFFRVVDPIPPITVPKGDSVIVTVEFDAPINGSYATDLMITHNDPHTGFQSAIALRAERRNPAMSVDGDTASAFLTCVHTGLGRQFVVRNTGAVAITVDSITVTQGQGVFTVSGASVPAAIAAGDSLAFIVTCTPAAPGPVTGTVEVHTSPCALVRILHLSGMGDATMPLVTPDPVDFGTVQAGGSAQRPVTITNPGTTTMHVQRVTIIPTLPEIGYVGAPPAPADIAPGGTLVFDLEYAPQVIGSLAVTLCIETSAPCVDTVCVDVRGDAQSAGVALDHSELSVQLDPCEQSTACDTVRLMNNALIALTVNEVSIAQTGSVLRIEPPIAVPFTLPAGGSVLITICGVAPLIGTAQGTLVVRSSDMNNPRLEMPLYATRDSANIAVTETELDFGALAHCETPKDMTLELRNTGTTPDDIDVARAPSAPFSIVTPLPVRMTGGTTLQVSVHFAPDTDGVYVDTLWLMSRHCGTIFPVVCRGSWDAQSAAVAPSALTFTGVNVGSSLVKNAVLTNLHRPRVNIARVVIVPPGMFLCETAMPAVLDSGATVTLGFRFTPVVKGAASATALVILDEPCPDTLRVALNGTGVDNGLVFRVPQLVFGALAQCETEDRADTLVNTGSGPFTLTSSTMTGPGAARYTILNPVTTNETLAGGAKRVFTLRFDPGTGPDGPLDATLAVTTSDSLQPVLDVPVTGVRRMQRTAADRTIPLGTVPKGVGTPVAVTLVNAGAGVLTYTGADLPATVTMAPPPPVAIAPGDSVTITLTVTPAASGTFSLVTTLFATDPCRDSTRITLAGTVAGGPRQTAAQYGTVPACAPVSRTLTFVNDGGSAVRVLDIRAAGTDSSFFAVVTPTVFPIDVAVGDSIRIVMELRPANASRTYAARCVTRLAAGGPVESPLDGASTRATFTGALPLDAGQGPTGTPVTAALTITNTSPFPVTITGAALAAMTVQATVPPLPATIAPGDSLRVLVEWTPQAVGAVQDTLALHTTAPCDERIAFAVEGRGLPGADMTTTLAVPVLEGRVDDHVLIPVNSSTDLGAAGATSWTGAVRFNRTMLWPLGVVKTGTLSEDMNVTMRYDHTTGTVFLDGSGAALRAGAGPLVMIEALVLIGNDIVTPVAIDPGFDFTSGRARVASRQNGEFHLVGYCLGEGNRLIRISGKYVLEQNRPNPFNPVTEIAYAIAVDGPVRLTVHDAWGREVATLVDAPQTAGAHTVRFDARALPSGVYYYRLVSGKFMETRKMVVSK